MDLRKMMVVCAVALSGLAVGCKSDCEKVCSDLKDCAGADATTKSTDCSKSCDDADKQAEKEGCKSQQDDLLSCVADQDICNESSLLKCASQASAYDTCFTNYCTAHADDPECGNTNPIP